ncbi:MAG: hypothetical protein JHC33_10960 [Ignisphaera sp.]|nr:hypothetical protein [Ignisphaera sp.]
MINQNGKPQHAKKYLSNYEDKSHKCYEPERLVFKWRSDGLSQEQIKINLVNYLNSERQKCIDDVTYFAENYGLISGPGGAGIIPFKLESYQKDLLRSFQSDKYVICNKARQLGVSTSLMFYSLWLSIFSTGKRCLVVAHRKESAEEYITKLKTAYEFLPEWLKPSCTLYSKSTVEFETKSSVKAITSNPHAARSFSATVFLVDEAAFIPKCDEVIKGLLPTISASDGKLIAISTPNGNSDQNWFYTTFTLAKAGINGWKWFELPWTVSSIFTKNPNFRADQIRIDNGNLDKFKQEYEVCFDVNQNALFSREALQAFEPSSKILNRAFGGVTYEDTLHIWKTAEYGENYVIGVDCASNKSTAKDSTSFQVINKDTIEQHAEYLGKLPTEVFADILIKTARHYNNALLIIEANTYSDILFYLLEQKGYRNIWYDAQASTPGFMTNRKTRPLLIEKLLLFFNNTVYMERLRSARLKMQMANFSAGTLYADASRKFEATKGSNDDAVIALALALIELTPKEFIHKPLSDFSIITETNQMGAVGDYSPEYLEYHSQRMGISPSVLANRLKIYHEIKSGVYDGSGLEDMELEHPVEGFERMQSTKDFIGVPLISQFPSENLDNFSMLPTNRKFTFDDLFDPNFQTMITANRNFLYGNRDF